MWSLESKPFRMCVDSGMCVGFGVFGRTSGVLPELLNSEAPTSHAPPWGRAKPFLSRAKSNPSTGAIGTPALIAGA
jgi:hypothetical protein